MCQSLIHPEFVLDMNLRMDLILLFHINNILSRKALPIPTDFNSAASVRFITITNYVYFLLLCE